MHRLGRVLLTGLLLAIAGNFFFSTPYGQKLEEEYGLAMLFKLRGPRQPSGKAVIVNIDISTSGGTVGASGSFSKWPRMVHAALVEKLTHYGAAIIAFDICFADHQNRDGDLVFAEAIRRAGNVVLAGDLQNTSAQTGGEEGRPAVGVEVERLIQPIEPLAEAALAVAPFPLPKVPIRVGQAWRFKETCGDLPTLPAAVFQAEKLGRYDQLLSLLRRKFPAVAKDIPASAEEALAAPGLVETMREIRGVFLRNSWLQKALLKELKDKETEGSAETSDELVALINMYGEESCVFIDFYGSPSTIETVSYEDVLFPDEETTGSIREKIKGRVIFVGAVASNWSDQKDGFYTVFSRPDGLDLSGVELAATVYENLVEKRAVRHMSAAKTIGVLSAFAVILCLVSFLLSPLPAAIILSLCIVMYLLGAYALFLFNGTWVPLMIPLTVMPLASFLSATLFNYLSSRRRHTNIHKALSYYLPGHVVDELSRDLSFITAGNTKVYGVCLVTDAQNYTRLSESLSPEELSLHMKEYYQYLFREVKRQEGMVCNVIGDSMLALWHSTVHEALLSRKACRASLQISEAVNRFNSKHPERTLPTRVGLHAGNLLMDNIGAEDHFEYAPVGDIVNTASRIEGLNKHLGTLMLASEEALQGVAGIASREIGDFLLSGKTRPVRIYELLAAKQYSIGRHRLHQKTFPEALSLFREGEWEKALVLFNHCLTLHAEDGPSCFYKQLCKRYIAVPPAAEKQGIIQVGK